MVRLSYLIFIAEVTDKKCQYKIINQDREPLGRIEKLRVGKWMSWCLFLNSDCYMSASCIDEVREKIRQLNSDMKMIL